MSKLHFGILGIIGLLPWLIWQGQWPSIVITHLDHCPILMCDFQRHYLPQAEILLDKPLSIVRGWFYPPLLAIALLPFAWSGIALWLWGGLLLLGLVFLTHLSLHAKHRKALPFIATLLFISSSLPILHGLKWGQISLLLVVLSIVGLIRGGQLGGAFIGLATAIKGYPFVYLLHPLLQRQLKPIIGAAAAFIGLGLLLPLVILGVEETQILYSNMSKSSQFVMLGAAESGGQALQSTLKRWFIDGTHVGRIDSVPRIAALPEFIIPIMWLVFAGLIAGLTMKHARQDSSERIPSICIVLCFVGLMLPPGWHHYFAFLPFVQLHLLQARPSKSSFRLLVLAILIDRIPIFGIGLSAHGYALASSFGTTTLSTILSWLAWINHLSSKNRKSNLEA